MSPVFHCRQHYDALEGERLISVLHKLVDFFSPLSYAGYLSHFSKRKSIQNIKDTNYPSAVYLTASKSIGTAFVMGLEYLI